MLLSLIPNKHRRSQGDQRGHGSPKFPAHIVLCFERQCPKPNTVARLNSKYLGPPKISGWLRYSKQSATNLVKFQTGRSINIKWRSRSCGTYIYSQRSEESFFSFER